MSFHVMLCSVKSCCVPSWLTCHVIPCHVCAGIIETALDLEWSPTLGECVLSNGGSYMIYMTWSIAFHSIESLSLMIAMWLIWDVWDEYQVICHVRSCDYVILCMLYVSLVCHVLYR